MTLHLTKVAVGCADIDELTARMAARAASEGFAYCLTRYKPKRAAELIGGSLFWIIGHRLVARQAIAAIDPVDTPEGAKFRIVFAGAPVAVVPMPRRAHQMWRYLDPAAAPRDVGAADGDLGALPPAMVRELAALGLV